MSAAILTFEQVKEVMENLDDEVQQLMEDYRQWLLSRGYSKTIDCHCI
jgi:mRNA-degrading endonuclease YafQ of YafQ-DinJ toxin-antitoxin module